MNNSSQNSDAVSPLASDSSPALGPALRNAFSQRRFLGAVLILAVAGVGLNAAAGFLRLHFRKMPVPLPVPSLRDEAQGIPASIGTAPGVAQVPWWVQVSQDEPLGSDIEQSLGTREHVRRDYVNVALLNQIRNAKEAKERTIGDDLWAEGEFRGKGGPFADLRRNGSPAQLVNMLVGLRSRPKEERGKVLGRISTLLPHAVMTMSMTYYTGLVDTVAHIPERCFVADGYEPINPETLGGQITLPDGQTREVKYRFIQFDDQTGVRINQYVGYLFHVNGHYESDPLEVRKRLQRLTERYGYYAKVELMTGGGDPRDTGGRDRAAAAMNDFIQAVLPEVERCLPDWDKVKNGQ